MARVATTYGVSLEQAKSATLASLAAFYPDGPEGGVLGTRPATEASEAMPRVWTSGELYEAENLVRPQGYLLDRIFCPKSVGLVAGRRGVGKTFLALQLAMDISNDRPFGHMNTKPGSVLFLSQEMVQEEVQDRFRELFRRDEMSDKLSVVCRLPFKADSDKAHAAMAPILAKAMPNVLIIDALRDIKGSAKEKDNDEMAAVMERLRNMADRWNLAVILIHHMGKPREDSHESGRGASVIEDVSADILYLSKSKDGKNLARWDKTRHRSIPDPFSYRLLKDEETGKLQISIGAEAAEMDDYFEVRKIVSVIKDQGGEMTQPEIIELMGWSRPTGSKHLKAAEALGLLASPIDRKLGKKIWRTV